MPSRRSVTLGVPEAGAGVGEREGVAADAGRSEADWKTGAGEDEVAGVAAAAGAGDARSFSASKGARSSASVAA